jgi:hypothetical protein
MGIRLAFKTGRRPRSRSESTRLSGNFDLSKHDEGLNEKLPYMSVEVPKSIREVYIHVAVIDIDISAGVTNIYIWGGRGETLEAGVIRIS